MFFVDEKKLIEAVKGSPCLWVGALSAVGQRPMSGNWCMQVKRLC